MEVAEGKRREALAPSQADPVGLDQSASASQRARVQSWELSWFECLSVRVFECLSAAICLPTVLAMYSPTVLADLCLWTKASRRGIQVGVPGVGPATLGTKTHCAARLHRLLMLTSLLVTICLSAAWSPLQAICSRCPKVRSSQHLYSSGDLTSPPAVG